MEIEDLKCCGNCNNVFFVNSDLRNTDNKALLCKITKKPDHAGNVCKYWTYDSINYKNREIEECV